MSIINCVIAHTVLSLLKFGVMLGTRHK